jgi:hypothetical protein
MQIVLRLLCLASITAGGIKTKSLENVKREILQVCICHFAAASVRRLTAVLGIWLQLPTPPPLTLVTSPLNTPS